MLFASFIKDNKEYVYLFQDNQIVYGYRNNDKICTDLTDEEKKVMDKICNKYIISMKRENHRKCGILNYNDKKYQIFYDKISKRKFFFVIGEKGYQAPSYQDFLYLDSYYNPKCVCEQQEETQDLEYQIQNLTRRNKKLNRNILFLDALTICCLLVTCYSTINYHMYKQGKVIEVNMDAFNLKEEVRTMEDLKEAIYNNRSLSSMEQEFILKHFPFIEENFEYLDLNLIYERLSNLVITYHPEECIDESGNVVEARYTDDNIIICYNSASFEEAVLKKEHHLDHEVYHVFTTHFSSLGNKVQEAFNEIVTLEYEMDNLQKGNYTLERKAVYLLIELLDKEVCRESYCKDDSEILIDKLVEIIDDEEKAYELLGRIDNLRLEYIDLKKNNPELFETEINYILYEPINETMNEYFVAKYGYDMMEDEIIENYLFAQGTRTTTISIEKAFASLKTCFDVTPKITGYTTYFVLPYFSKEYKKTSQMIQIYYDKSNAKGTFCYEVQAIEREQKTRK